MASPRIAIIGAGPAGLTLARILHLNSIETTIFEGEDSPNVRSQGGSLDLHPKSGQLALKEAGLFDQFEKHARYEGEDLILCDKTGKRHVEILDTDTGRPEIDRVKLRQILLNSLPEGMIQWGHRVKSVEISTITFEKQPTQTGFDLIVGADGAWSKVRHLLTHVPPFYSGISGFDIRLADADKRHPEISELAGKGTFFAFGEEDHQVLIMQRNGDGALRVYAVGSRPERWIKDSGIDFGNVDEVRKAMLKDYEKWSPELKRVLEDFDVKGGDSFTPRALYMLPVGLYWPTRPGATLVGDAAHLMTPFAGEGVNQAMQDAMELALAIIKTPNDLTSAVKVYEEAMFPRAKETTESTWESLLARFAPGGLAMFKKRIQRSLARHQAANPGVELKQTVRFLED